MVQPWYYLTVYLIIVTSISLLVGGNYFSSNGYQMQEKGNRDIIVPTIICVLLVFYLGSRQPWAHYFGDTSSYLRTYSKMDTIYETINIHTEWLWNWLMVTSKSLGLTFNTYLLIIEALYFGTVLIAIKIIFPDNILLALMFVVTSLMFYPFGVNGIRNGLACHILLLGLAFFLNGRSPIGIFLFAIAFSIHRSTMLPIAATIAAIYWIKDVKIAIFFWCSSIVISFFAGGFFTNFFAGLGFDDRMTQYSNELDTDAFSRVGFRWDFLLYSSMPVILSWYVCVVKGISDSWYNTISIIYCLCNAFWVMVIRSSYSNRFAYLSWFLYPFVIAYPLIMLPVWDDQDQKIAIILYAYVGFTIVMNFLWGNIYLG